MKKLIFLVIAFLLFPFFVINASAYDDSDAEIIASEAQADKLSSEYLTREEASGDRRINIFEKAYAIFRDSLNSQGIPILRSFGGILALITLCAAMNAMKFGESLPLDTACGYISVLALSGVSYSVFYNLFISVIACMESLTLTVSSLMPIMSSLYVFGGSPSVAVANNSALLLFLSVISLLCTKILLPLLRVLFALCLVGAMPSGVNLSPITNLVKSTANVLMSFMFTLVGFVLYFQTAIAKAGDGFAMKSLRFASGVFVPVIGNMLGDAASTVVASVSVVKGCVGGVGVVMIIAAILPAVLSVLLHRLMLSCCAAIAKVLSCERESLFLNDLSGVLGLLFSLLLGSGAVSIIALAVFLRTGGA